MSVESLPSRVPEVRRLSRFAKDIWAVGPRRVRQRCRTRRGSRIVGSILAAAAAVCLFADEAGLELALCYVFSWQQLARHSSFAEMKTISCAEAVSIHFLTGFQCGAVCARGGVGGHPMRDINYSDPRNISVYVDYFQDLQL